MHLDRIMGLAVGLAAAALYATPAPAQPLSTDPTTYFILGRDEVRLKNFELLTSGPGCNVGVNDTGGLLRSTDSSFSAPDSQLAADDCGAAGGDVAQCFCDAGGIQFDEVCVPFPGILADETLATYIAACNTLPGGDFPLVCVPGAQDVVAPRDDDCDPPALDTATGNGQCDLPPGDYGAVRVKRKATLSLDGGVYTVDSYLAERDTTVLTDKAPVTLNVCGDDELKLGDKGAIVGACGSLRINYVSQVGAVNIGNRKNFKNLDPFATMHVCAPSAEIKLSRNNALEGNFFATFTSSDFNNVGKCCNAAQAGLCACFDTVAPTTVSVGGTLTLSGGCDLTNLTQVLVCGAPCAIQTQTDAEVTCTVADPGGLPQLCPVEGLSTAGSFTSATAVTVNP